MIQIGFSAGILYLIKGQPLTGQLEKSRKVQIQRAESLAENRWTREAGGMAIASQRRAYNYSFMHWKVHKNVVFISYIKYHNERN